MSDLIDRQALRLEMYHEAFEKGSDMQKWDSGCWIRYKLFERVVDRQPSAQPEIVRCRECKHHDGVRCFRWNSTIITGFDDFCSNGERRDEDDTRAFGED